VLSLKVAIDAVDAVARSNNKVGEIISKDPLRANCRALCRRHEPMCCSRQAAAWRRAPEVVHQRQPTADRKGRTGRNKLGSPTSKRSATRSMRR
jgi:hypothetical protein